jgi:hypothetical protein
MWLIAHISIDKDVGPSVVVVVNLAVGCAASVGLEIIVETNVFNVLNICTAMLYL